MIEENKCVIDQGTTRFAFHEETLGDAIFTFIAFLASFIVYCNVVH